VTKASTTVSSTTARVFSEANVAEKLYDKLRLKGCKPFWDKESLKSGENWKVGFLRGLKNSRTFLAVISSQGLERCRDASRDHTNDNVLLEYQMALAINESNGKFIIPVHAGEYAINGDLKKFSNSDSFNTALYSGLVDGSGAVPKEAVLAQAQAEFDAADVLYDQANYSEALRLHELCLATRLKFLGEADPKVADSYHKIARTLEKYGLYPKALSMYENALAIRLEAFGAEHVDVASSYSGIGSLCEKQGNYPKALECQQKSLAIRLKSLGEEHADVATCYSEIGLIYDRQGKTAESLEISQRALAIRLKVLGAEHPDVAESYEIIGFAHESQKDYSKALEFYEKGLAIYLKVLGAEHPRVAFSYNNIGHVHHAQKDYSKALEFYEKGLAIYLKVLGAEHADTKSTQTWLHNSKKALGQ